MYSRVQCKRNITLIDERLCKKLSCNQRELNENGTVDNVVSYQFLCTLYIKFLKTGCNIFNNCSLHTAIFLILQPAHCDIFNIAAYLFSAFNYITPDNFPADKKDSLRFPQTVVLSSQRLQSLT